MEDQNNVISFYREKIKLLKVRHEYQKYDTEILELLARKYEALNKIAFFNGIKDGANTVKDGDKKDSEEVQGNEERTS